MISVCIATYNGEQFIRQQLESIIVQLSKHDEIIVSDDHSTDHTLEIIQNIACPLIKIYHNQGEKGYTSNFENALKQAKGDYIFLSDQDDIWLPDKVNQCIEALQYHALVATNACIIDENENCIHNSFFKLRQPKQGLAGNIIKFGYLGCCMAFRKEVLQKALPFPQHRLLCTHDNWIFLVAQAFFSVKIISKPLIHYRRHQANASAGQANQHKSIVFRLQYRAYLITQLLLRFMRKQ